MSFGDDAWEWWEESRKTPTERAYDQGVAQGVSDTMATYVDIKYNDGYDPDGYKDLINEEVNYADYDWSTYAWQVTTPPEDWNEEVDGVFESDINYAWYASDPMYVRASIDEDIDISTEEGLIEATKYIIETSKVILSGGFGDIAWRTAAKELEDREPYVPKRLDVSDYYTEPADPKMSRRMRDPNMRPSLSSLKVRSGSTMSEEFKFRNELN